MRLLDRYIAVTVSAMMALTIFGILGIITVFALMEEMGKVEGNYQVVDAARYIAYITPRQFYEVIPFGAMIGALLGLGMLANTSELIVIRAAGVSIARISWSVMKPTAVLVLVGLLVGEYIVPESERIAQHGREKALSDSLMPASGYWYREGNTFMQFSQVPRAGVLEDVSHYVFDDSGELQRTLFARRAVYHDVRANEQYWLLEDVTVTNLSGEAVATENISSLRWETEVDPDLLRSEILVEPNKLSMAELRTKIEHMARGGLNTTRYQLAFWQKGLQPIATLALVVIAISSVFGPLREATMGMRIVSGLIIGIVFKFLQDLLAPASMVFGFSPPVATLLPIVICFVTSVYLIRRMG